MVGLNLRQMSIALLETETCAFLKRAMSLLSLAGLICYAHRVDSASHDRM